MAPRGQVDLLTQEKVFAALKENWLDSSAHLAQRLGFGTPVVASALTAYTQAGRVIYDLKQGVYRVRELSREPLDMQLLRFGSEQEKLANELIDQDRVKISSQVENDHLQIRGKVKTRTETFTTLAVVDKDQRLIEGNCECSFFKANRLRKGPCEHILATRIAFGRNAKAITA